MEIPQVRIEHRLLLKLHAAALNGARKRLASRMQIHMISQKRFLRELRSTDEANVIFNT